MPQVLYGTCLHQNVYHLSESQCNWVDCILSTFDSRFYQTLFISKILLTAIELYSWKWTKNFYTFCAMKINPLGNKVQ